MGGSEFACRHCYNLTYASRNESRRGDIEIFRKLFKAESIEEQIKKRFYKGKPTKKYRQLLALMGN